MNELLLIMQLVVFYGMVILFYRLFGKKGLLCWTVLATILANIEVLIQVHAFGMDMTLGNIMFATSFVVTDILSEVAGKEYSKKAVNIGIATSICFIVCSQSWLLFTPNEYDFAMPSFITLFQNTPRLIGSSLIVYAIVQRFDVWAYHKWWNLTERICNNSHKFLWLRNNGSTLISQLFNAVLYCVFAFAGTIPNDELKSIIFSTYIIYIFTSVLDTPVVYICRYLKETMKINEN